MGRLPRPTLPATLLVLVLALVLAGCSSGAQDAADPDPTQTRSGSAVDRGDGPLPDGGTPGDPVAVRAGRALLDWSPVPGPVEATVVRNSTWTLTADEAGSSWRLEGPGPDLGGEAGARERISDARLDQDWAVVVLQDTREQRAGRAVVTELATGDQFTLDGSSEVPTTNGGSWALGQGQLAHATVSDRAYCLAVVDLPSGSATPGWCAPPRHGFNGVRITPSGLSLMTFDDSRPSCRTVARVVGSETVSFPAVSRCSSWEGLLLEDGEVWSEIPREKRIEEALLRARVGDDHYDLGAGTSGTLTWCAGAAYFVRDPQRTGDPARLLRWDPERGLDVVHESPSARGFLTAPRCGGDTLTVTVFDEAGDEQVSARLD